MLSPTQRTALAQLEGLWRGRCVLIGASALLVHRPNEGWRPTKDIDVLVAGDLKEVERVEELGWSRDPRRFHRWRLPKGGWVDLVPAGPEIRAAGQLVWPDGQVMSTAGLNLAFEHAVESDCEGVRFRVAPLPVLFVLKVVAFTERPDRRHDLADIARLIDAYIPDDDERRWDADIPEDISFEATSAYLLGCDIVGLVGDELQQLLRSFCADARKAPLDLSPHRLAPVSWRASPTEITERISALSLGLGSRAPNDLGRL